VLLSNGFRIEPIVGLAQLHVDAADPSLLARYDLTPRSCYLIRPDQYVAGRFKHPSEPEIKAALRRAGGEL
jgi:3-(3-hydroxy-phenyl)propionate hydroxylase